MTFISLLTLLHLLKAMLCLSSLYDAAVLMVFCEFFCLQLSELLGSVDLRCVSFDKHMYTMQWNTEHTDK